MLARLTSLALLVSFLPACATQRQAGAAAGVLGVASAATIATGIGTLVEGSDCRQEEDCDVYGLMYAAGAALLVTGALIGVGAVAVYHSGPDDEPAPGPIVEARPLAPPSSTPAVNDAGLPARATDEATLRLANQAYRAAALGRCSAARITLREIADRDADYHAELAAVPAIAACI